MKLQVQVHAAIDLLGEFGADAGVRQDDADLDFLSYGETGSGSHDSGRHNRFLEHDDLPLA
jgi:hypothetical protein